MKSIKYQVRNHIWDDAREEYQDAVIDSVFEKATMIYSQTIDEVWMTIIECLSHDERIRAAIDWPRML